MNTMKDNDVLRPAVENVARMRNKRLCDKTKANYASRITTLKRWIQKHPNARVSLSYLEVSDNLKLPLDSDAILEFFGYIGDEVGVFITGFYYRLKWVRMYICLLCICVYHYA